MEPAGLINWPLEHPVFLGRQNLRFGYRHKRVVPSSGTNDDPDGSLAARLETLREFVGSVAEVRSDAGSSLICFLA